MAAPPLTLTGYGGVGEIGGNAFLLDDGKTRLMLDIGRRFGASAVTENWNEAFARRPGWGDYFDAFLRARSFAAATDLMALDLIPPLPSLYRTDLGGQAGAPPVDRILVSHAHQDHFGLLGLVRHDVPVISSAQTAATLSSLETTGFGSWETDLREVQLRGGVQWTQPKGKDAAPALTSKWRYDRDERGIERPFSTSSVTEVGDWTIASHAVDHSIQGATGFILTRKDGYKVVYTGDFRMHGRDPRLTDAFLREAQDPDVLIMEGTRVGRGSEARGHGHGDAGHGGGGGGAGHDADPEADAGRAVSDTESGVERQVEAFIADYESRHGAGFVGIGYPIRDLDRLMSLHAVARRLGRRLVLQPRQAHLLLELRTSCGREDLPDPRTDAHLAVYVKTSGKGVARDRSGTVLLGNKATLALQSLQASPEQWEALVSADLDLWERAIVGAHLRGKGNVVVASDVRAEPHAYLFTLSYWNMTDLFDVFADRARARGLYIHSQTQPFNDDLELTAFKLRRWLRAFHLGDPVGEPRITHVSGHASPEALRHVLETLRPKTLVPVHSENPGASADWYTHRTGQRSLLPSPGTPLTLL